MTVFPTTMVECVFAGETTARFWTKQVQMEEAICHHDDEACVRRKNYGMALDDAGRFYKIAIHQNQC